MKFPARAAVVLVFGMTMLEHAAEPPQAQATPKPENKLCPVMPEEPVNPQFTMQFEGRTIGFCCEKCVAKFIANPDRYRERVVAMLAQAVPAETEAPTLVKSPDDNGMTWVDWLGRYHPVLVHFPVAGAPLALLGLCVWLATRNPWFAAADVPPLFAGGLVSIAAVVTGNIAEKAAGFTGSLHQTVERHELAGTTLMIVTLVLCGVRVARWRSLSGVWLRVYAIGLILATGLAAITGFLGGTLVFGSGHLWP